MRATLQYVRDGLVLAFAHDDGSRVTREVDVENMRRDALAQTVTIHRAARVRSFDARVRKVRFGWSIAREQVDALARWADVR